MQSETTAKKAVVAGHQLPGRRRPRRRRSRSAPGGWRAARRRDRRSRRDLKSLPASAARRTSSGDAARARASGSRSPARVFACKRTIARCSSSSSTICIAMLATIPSEIQKTQPITLADQNFVDERFRKGRQRDARDDQAPRPARITKSTGAPRARELRAQDARRRRHFVARREIGAGRERKADARVGAVELFPIAETPAAGRIVEHRAVFGKPFDDDEVIEHAKR